MTLTAAQALADIQSLTNPTVAQIKNIVSQVDTSIPLNKTAYLYSGDVVYVDDFDQQTRNN